MQFPIAWWLARHAVHQETPELDWLRRWSLRFGTFGGTDFREAILTGAGFSQADLKYAQLADAKLSGTRWRDAKNLPLAHTYGTVLQPKAVRQTLTTGQGEQAKFVGLDLHGLDFSGMALAEADFRDADLSGARFIGADLTAARLDRAVLLGADLSQARLTGACISHWNIDKRTRFEGADCEYVYLNEDQYGRVCERQPATGAFRPGEFAKLYQEIANTVDFLIETPAQMEALLRTLAKIREDFGDPEVAEVSKVERKDGAWKVGVSVPPELVDSLRAELHQEFAAQFQALQAEHRYALLEHRKDAEHLREERDSLKEMLILALNRPNNIHVEAKAMHDDNSRNIKNSPISGSAVNLGDGSHVANTVRIGAEVSELESLLGRLREAIGAASLPEAEKSAALEKVAVLRQAADQPEPKRQITAAGALGALESVGKVAGATGALLALAKAFGL